MAYCRRRTLTSNYNLLSRRLTPSFAHIRRDDHERNELPNRVPFPTIPFLRSGHASAFPSPVFPFRGSRDLGFSLPLGLSPCHLRSYSSSNEPSSETDGVDDVAVVLSDSSVEIASAAAVLPPVPVPGEVAAAAADSFLPVAALQHLIDAVHSFSGLNWWAAIVLTTVLIRVATIPLILNQMKSTVKLNMMRPEIDQIKEQMNPMDPQSVQEGQQQMKALFLKYGVTPFTPLKGLFIQGPIFISFFLAISNMVEKVPSFKGGGAFWFTDLTTPDPQYMLPVLAALTFLATVELNMQEGMEGNPMLNTMKNFSRVIALMTVPFTAHFPKAIFCYWITSNLFSLAHGFAMRQPPVRKFLKLPDLASQPAPAAQPDFSTFGGSKPMAPTAPPLPAKESEQSNTPGKRLSTSTLISLRIRSLEKAMKARNRLKKRRNS
ncbi:mitochondrial inner membrane protein OXA1-like [Zingiber officinale]|uniref:mitochondrial inner membrane protein OXA1-like n=1 Tax=Zingiber officinale TaxID=94328 RepID=UPI001C4A770C|nr:mitochondrial inner membrane protein OXA1-like [Zingiber officinale]